MLLDKLLHMVLELLIQLKRKCLLSSFLRPISLPWTDYVLPSEVEWSGEASAGNTTQSQILPSLQTPMPTVYNGSSSDPIRPHSKPTIIEMVLYNMAAMLASFAAGYDVRLSNVTLFHPCLQPER